MITPELCRITKPLFKEPIRQHPFKWSCGACRHAVKWQKKSWNLKRKHIYIYILYCSIVGALLFPVCTDGVSNEECSRARLLLKAST